MSNLLKSTVIKNTPLNYKFHHLIFESHEPDFIFKTGQFTALKVGDNIFRSYSVASTPHRLPTWEMFVDITPGGPGTTYIRNLNPGDVIETTKPVGIFTLASNAKNYILGATGCGLASIKPMIEELLSKNSDTNVELFWGLRFEKDIVLEDSLKTLQEKYPNFRYRISLSKPEINWSGKTGYITQHIAEVIENELAGETEVYLCGNTGLIADTKEVLQKINFPTDKIYFEKYY